MQWDIWHYYNVQLWIVSVGFLLQEDVLLYHPVRDRVIGTKSKTKQTLA